MNDHSKPAPTVTAFPSMSGTHVLPLRPSTLHGKEHTTPVNVVTNGVCLWFRDTEEVFDWLAHVRQQVTAAIVTFNTPTEVDL